MIGKLKLTNSLTRKKEIFEPINPPEVGMYVCGPTVYSNVHLGNLRTFISFDIINRYLKYLGYKVRYVRNITDVGHLLDSGEDKISKKARKDKLEPMEIVQKFTNDFHNVMKTFNVLPPDIEPSAIGHLLEQIKMIETLISRGFAYEANGSVYFDLIKYNKLHLYGKLSGRKMEDLINQSRTLEGQDDKKNPLDFALWKKAAPNHIMKWKTKWSDGFPGWHLECSVMSTKYLGTQFDIHGGGLDLKFPHHDCEIAQCLGSSDKEPAKYWMHTNMLTVNGQKMSKSLGNSFLPWQLISGNHKLLDRGYSPMAIRFFMLQSHYASTLDFSNEALNGSLKGYTKLANGIRILKEMIYPKHNSLNVNAELINQIDKLCDDCNNAMNDDFNTALTIGHLFNLLKKVNAFYSKQISLTDINQATFDRMKTTLLTFTEEILGIKPEKNINGHNLLKILLKDYTEAKATKNYEKVDLIRRQLAEEGIIINDMKDFVGWAYNE